MIDFYTRYSEVIYISAFLLPMIAAAVHYVMIGEKGPRLGAEDNVIQRFSRSERIFHFIRMLTFLVVAATGYYFVFRHGFKSIGMVHSINGSIFFLMSVSTLFIWFKSGLFKDYDRLWLKHLGGYFSRDELSLPAGKFNAGQKIFHFLSLLFAIILLVTGINLIRGQISQTPNDTVLVIHGITAALAIISVLGHIYLSLWVNKGTWRVLTHGKVSEQWAQCHHPNWKADTQAGGVSRGI